MSGAGLYGVPGAAELVEAVREFLDGEVTEEAQPDRRYRLRVASAALRVVERQLDQAPAAEDEHRRRLAALGYRDDHELAEALRRGAQDPSDPALLSALRSAARDKLAVSNPSYLKEDR